MSTLTDPTVIVVILPVRPDLASDRETERGFARGLCSALRESYPDSILDVQWSTEATAVKVECFGTDVAEDVLGITRRFSSLWLLALQSVRDFICRRMASHAALLPLDSQIQAPCRASQ